MYEVKESDLKLSENFKTIQLELEEKKQILVYKNKTINDQTIESCLLFQSNISYYKTLTKNLNYFERKNHIKRIIFKNFPKADLSYLDKEINKVFLSYKLFTILLLSALSLIFIITSFLLSLFNGFEINHIYIYYLPLLCVLGIIYFFIDMYVTE